MDLERPKNLPRQGGAGFRIGSCADIDDHRAACFANNGVVAALFGKPLKLGKKTKKLGVEVPLHATLMVVGQPTPAGGQLTMSVADPKRGKALGRLSESFKAAELQGNIVLCSQLNGNNNRSDKPVYRFRDWQIAGDVFRTCTRSALGGVGLQPAVTTQS